MGALDLIRKGVQGVKSAPFFSKVDEVLDSLPRNKGTGDEFLREIEKTKGVKPAEIQDRGIAKALKGKPKMTKSEVQKIFESNPPPRVQEKVLSSDVPDYDEWLDAKALEMYGEEFLSLSSAEQSKLNKMYGALDLTQYDRYKTPGGENYREILLKLPKQEKPITDADIEDWYSRTYMADIADDAGPDWRKNREDFIRDMTSSEREDAFGAGYISPHYKTEPNVLAHIRVQDFKTPDGRKVLLVDEIQSDWHQSGRKQGYKSGDEEEKIWDLTEQYNNLTYRRKNLIKEAEAMNNAGPAFLRAMDEIGEITPKLMNLQQQMDDLRNISSHAVPDAPFKKNWHELAMKRVLDYAAENGYDSIAITPGAEQAKRYDLSKVANAISYHPDDNGRGMFLNVFGKNNEVIYSKLTPEAELSNVIGKETSEKLLSQAPDDGNRVLTGLDLQVGGEGMKGFYDKILPDYLNNFGKQYGASVREAPLNYTPSAQRVAQGAQDDALLGQLGVDIPTVAPTQYHMFDITPQLRDEVKAKGLPMYGKVATPALEGLAAGTGAATIGSEVFDTNNEQQVQNPVHFTENPDAMLLELMQRN
jgi:hypothetical protein